MTTAHPYRWWIALPLLLLALGALALLSARATLASQPVMLVTGQEGAIRYVAAFDPTTQQVNGTVTYDYLAADGQGIRDYLAFNQRIARELAQSGAATLRFPVIFNHPLSQAEFEELVWSYGLTVHSYTLRAVEADGTRVTIRGGPQNGQLVPVESYNAVQSDLSQRGATQLTGWIEADVTTNAATLDRLQRDPTVLAIEGTYALIYRALTPDALRRAHAEPETIQAIQAGTNAPVQVTGPPLSWSLEDLGLIPMPLYIPE